jgi:hypothetical protein
MKDMVNRGLGNLTPGEFQSKLQDANFVKQYNLGKVYSYTDLAKESLSTDPNFDPTDTEALNSFATQLKDRGLTNKNLEDIRTLATNWSVKNAYEKASSPEKYLTPEESAANLSQAQNLVKTIYGQDYQDSEGLTQFVADKIAGGESAYELAQFLKTTPDYQTRQADIESTKATTEAAAQREALNTELVKSQQEVFQKAQPAILSSYMKAGRLNSSSLDAALANAQKDLESQRQGFLANAAYTTAQQQSGYNREDFVNQQNQAYKNQASQSDYSMQQNANLQNIGNQLTYQQPYNDLSRYYNLSDQARQRQYDLEDYAAQRSDFYNALSEQKKQQKQNAIYGLLGSAIGGASQAGTAALLCFSPDTFLNLNNGKRTKISEIKLGDQLSDGGIVVGVRDAVTSDILFDYNGILVTEFHAVKENGEWKRVGKSINGKRLEPAGLVRSLITTTHRIFIDGNEFADEYETENGGNITLDDSLKKLNEALNRG